MEDVGSDTIEKPLPWGARKRKNWKVTAEEKIPELGFKG